MRTLRFSLVALVVVIGLQSTVTLAQAPPTRYYGTILFNGQAPALDTLVQAFVGDVLCGETTVRQFGDVEAGEDVFVGYALDVQADSQVLGCGIDGGEVTFRVGGVPAAETGTFVGGTFVALDLTASDDPTASLAPPAPEPIAEPEPEPEPEPEG